MNLVNNKRQPKDCARKVKKTSPNVDYFLDKGQGHLRASQTCYCLKFIPVKEQLIDFMSAYIRCPSTAIFECRLGNTYLGMYIFGVFTF